MSDQQYYRILLDDYSAASFTSFDKAYFGTMSDLEGWIKAIEVEKCFAERFSSLTKTFRAYQSGQHNITHNVAYQEVRFLDSHSTLPPTQAGACSASGGALFPGGGITKGSIVWSTAAFLSVSWAWARCSSG